MKDEIISDSLQVALSSLCSMTEQLLYYASTALKNSFEGEEFIMEEIKNCMEGVNICFNLVDKVQKIGEKKPAIEIK